MPRLYCMSGFLQKFIPVQIGGRKQNKGTYQGDNYGDGTKEPNKQNKKRWHSKS